MTSLRRSISTLDGMGDGFYVCAYVVIFSKASWTSKDRGTTVAAPIALLELCVTVVGDLYKEDTY